MKIVIDSREKTPFNFLKDFDISVEFRTLPTGDYSLPGMEHLVAVERKSLPDLTRCLGTDRARFERELLRAAALESFCVVVEADWRSLEDGRYQGQLDPGAACASVAAFMARYGVPFFFAGSRQRAEAFTALFLRQYLKGKAKEADAIRKAMVEAHHVDKRIDGR